LSRSSYAGFDDVIAEVGDVIVFEREARRRFDADGTQQLSGGGQHVTADDSATA